MKRFLLAFLILILGAGVFAADKPLIFGSHLGNFEAASDPLWLGWRGPDGRIDAKIADEDLRLAANAGAGATRLFKPTFELKIGTNLWDVANFNSLEFEDAAKAIAICKKYNIEPWLTLWFNHSEPTPWKNNVQGLKDPYSSIPLSEAYIEMVVGKLGKDIYYEIICEPAYKGNGTSASYMKPGSSSYWLAKMIEKLWALGVPPSHICYGAELVYTYDKATKTFKVNSTRDMVGQAAEVVRVDLKAKGWSLQKINDNLNAGWQTQHNCGRAPEEVDGVTFPNGYDNQFCINTWLKPSALRRVLVSDDGAAQGKPYVSNPQPDGRWPRNTPLEGYTAAKGLLKYPRPLGLSIEVLGYKHNGEIYAQLREVSRAVFEATGFWPDNWQRFAAGDPDPPEPPAPPAPGPDPKAGKVGILAAIAAALLAFWKKIVAWYRKKGAWWWWLILIAAVALFVAILWWAL